jgi:Zn-dependent peptidase ImmA (M78 family)
MYIGREMKVANTLEQAISVRRRILGNPYAFLDELEEIAELKAIRHASENPYAYADELDRLSRGISRFDGIETASPVRPLLTRARRRTNEQIENLARQLHVQIWERRSELFADFMSRNPVDMLDPIAALKLLGYTVDLADALGQLPGAGRASNVAGLIDKSNRQVLLSSGFPAAIRNFTAAHELGHASMHDLVGMHRDKPMDGSSGSADPQEREAEKFAAYFLMPQKLVRRMFERTFGSAPFELNDDTRFALSGAVADSTRWQPKSVRELARLLSSTSRFNGSNIVPFAVQFGVSREAMAIRLEQLGLVRWSRD